MSIFKTIEHSSDATLLSIAQDWEIVSRLMNCANMANRGQNPDLAADALVTLALLPLQFECIKVGSAPLP